VSHDRDARNSRNHFVRQFARGNRRSPFGRLDGLVNLGILDPNCCEENKFGHRIRFNEVLMPWGSEATHWRTGRQSRGRAEQPPYPCERRSLTK
jgi:hypothetical protein